MTHTYAILKVSQAAYDEIKAKLVEVGYDHAFLTDALGLVGNELIDIHGIAIEVDDDPGMGPDDGHAGD